jgi:hypothetical protein
MSTTTKTKTAKLPIPPRKQGPFLGVPGLKRPSEADDGIPESLRVENRKPLTPEQQAKVDQAMAKRGVTSPAIKQTDQASAAAIKQNGKHANQHHTPVPVKQFDAKGKPKVRPLLDQADRQKNGKAKAAAVKPAKKAKSAKVTKKAKATRRGDGPTGKVTEILKLASRPNGASREELNTLTKWSGAPWKWLFKNPKGTGFCDRHGYTLRIAEGKEGETRYRVTKR